VDFQAPVFPTKAIFSQGFIVKFKLFKVFLFLEYQKSMFLYSIFQSIFFNFFHSLILSKAILSNSSYISSTAVS